MADRAQILITAVDQTRAALSQAKGNLESLSVAASKVNGVLAGLGAALSVGALVAATKAALDTADGLSKLAQKTGMSVESLSLLKPIAEQSGISMEGLAKGLQKLATSMFDAARGIKEPADAFAQLGVAFTDASGQLRPTEAVLLDLANAFSAMPDGAEKSALAVKLFGKSGVELIPFLNQGASGIEELKQKFKDLGLEISGNTARSSEKFNDTLDTVKQALSGVAMRIAEAALPALQSLAEGLVAISRHGDALISALQTIGEVVAGVLAVRVVSALASIGASLAVLKTALSRFLPVLLAIGAWEVGKGIVNMALYVRDANQAVDELAGKNAQLQQFNAAVNELANTGTLSLKTQMALAAQAAERLKKELPAAAANLRAMGGAATQAGQAIQQALTAETQKAAETVKQLSASYKQVASDIKANLNQRVADIEESYQRQEQAAQNTSRSESAAISQSTQALLSAERDKLSAVENAGREMENAWKQAYAQAESLARESGQNVANIEQQAVQARIAIYSQLEGAYRTTVDRLLAEEQRHLQGVKSAEEARLNLKLSVEDRIRELSRKGQDDYAAYQDRQRQIDEKQAQAKAELAAGNFEQARKLAEESISLAERNASEVKRQVEENGKTVTQTVVSEASAAANAISQIKESASIADNALKGLGDAHKTAANAAGAGAEEAKRALAGVSDEIAKMRQSLLNSGKLKLDVDIESAKDSIEKIKALTSAQKLVAIISADTSQAQDALEKLKDDADNIDLIAKFEADTTQVLGDINALKSTLSNAGLQLPVLAAFDQPRQQLSSFVQNARVALSVPTQATHTVQPDLARYRAAVSELLRPTSSTHTVYVRQVQTHAGGGWIQKFADGGRALADGFRRVSGRVFGPGTETSDSVPALLSRGEYVVRAASVRQFGEAFFASLNAGFLPTLPRFASGGLLVGSINQFARPTGQDRTPTRDIVDLRFDVGGKQHTVQSSRATAMQLAQALRELSRGA